MYLLIDKPKGMTSHDVVDKVREITGEKRVGHAGTLDPNATGLLIIGVGRESTKKLARIAKLKKEYEAEIYLGEEKDTDDAEGQVVKKFQVAEAPRLREVTDVLENFLGERNQVPPVYSAIKIKGRKAYELARKGKALELKSRKITVYSIKLLEYKYPLLTVRFKVSSGTYIRALARDIGRALRCGAYLKNLKRTKIGKFHLRDSTPLDFINKANFKK